MNDEKEKGKDGPFLVGFKGAFGALTAIAIVAIGNAIFTSIAGSDSNTKKR